MLALARRFAGKPAQHTLRFVAFVNEEPPYFLTGQMGSFVYAGRCKARGDRISAMISLETIGYFSDAPHSQTYPAPGLGVFYPSVGNFIGFVSNVPSRNLLRRAIALFRKHAKIPSEGAALPAFIPGVSWSDQWSFWQHGYPGIMITDTAPFRYPHYHSATDTPDKLDYDRFALVVSGMETSDRRTRQVVAGVGDPGHRGYAAPRSHRYRREGMNSSSAATSRARDRSRPIRRFRLGRCDKRRGVRSRAFRQRRRQPPASDNEAEPLRPLLPTKRLRVRESPSRLKCCRGLSEFAARPDPPAARDSTSQTGAE